MRNLFWILAGGVVTGFLLVVAFACGPQQGWAMTFLVMLIAYLWHSIGQIDDVIDAVNKVFEGMFEEEE